MVMDGGGHPESKMRFLAAEVSILSVRALLSVTSASFLAHRVEFLYVLATVCESLDTSSPKGAVLRSCLSYFKMFDPIV